MCTDCSLACLPCCVLCCAVLWCVQLFGQDQLLLRCAAHPSLSRPVAAALLPQLLRVAKREETLRVQLWGAGGLRGGCVQGVG